MRLLVQVIVITVCCVQWAGTCFAELNMRVEPVGGFFDNDIPVEGGFDIYFEVSGESPPPLSGYDLVLELSPSGSGVRFVSAANPSGDRDAVFPAAGPIDLSSAENRDHRLQLTAFVFTGSEQPIVDGIGLVRVRFETVPGTIGIFDVRINSDATILADNHLPDANLIDFTTANGQIVIAPPGDADVDGDVDFLDFLRLQNHFLDPGTWIDGDFNNDGVVDFLDFLILQNSFEKDFSPGSSGASPNAFGGTYPDALGFSNVIAIPEPQIVAVLGSGLMWLLRRQVRS